MRKALVVTTLVAAIAATTLAGAPAQAQSVTFSLSGGSLAVAEPGTAALTAGSLVSLAGSAFTGSLGSTTVTDQRGGVTGWTNSIAQTTAFANTNTTIPVGNTHAWVGSAITPTSGVATVTSLTYVSQVTGLALTASAQAFVTATAVVGNNVTSFNPSIAVTVPNNATAGNYSGVITQTVA